jgi:hypothetical protein
MNIPIAILPDAIRATMNPTGIDWRVIPLLSGEKKENLIKLYPDPLARAKYIAYESFNGKFRRDNTPAISHMERIVSRVERFKDSELEQIAWLHDLIEEKKYTLKDLEDLGFSPRVIAAVDALSKREMQGEGYLNYIERLAQNIDAITVKLFDINDNSSIGVRPERADFLYPIAKEYLIDTKRRHNRKEPLIAITDFMDQNERIERVRNYDPALFHQRAAFFYNSAILSYHIS